MEIIHLALLAKDDDDLLDPVHVPDEDLLGGEVHSGDVHPVLDELEQGLGRAADGSDGADDAGEAHLVGGGVHVQRARALDVGVAGAGPLLPGRHIALLQD